MYRIEKNIMYEAVKFIDALKKNNNYIHVCTHSLYFIFYVSGSYFFYSKQIYKYIKFIYKYDKLN